MHVSQPVPPALAWNVPAAQLVHVEDSAEAPYVPGAHAVGALDPTEQKVPAGHTRHSLSLVMTAERIGEATAATAAASDGAFIGALGAATLPPPHPGMTKDEYLSSRARRPRRAASRPLPRGRAAVTGRWCVSGTGS